MSPPYACNTYGFCRLEVNARIVVRSVGFASVPVSFGNGIFFRKLPGARRRVRIEDVEITPAAGLL
jgi:hypothetical protein